VSDFYSATPLLQDATARAFDLRPDAEGYYEFGLFKGYNLWAAEQYAHTMAPQCRFYGFDSFRGIPANNSGQWAEGEFACSREQVEKNLRDHGALMDRITLVEGWFAADMLDAVDMPPADVVVVDSDLYESAVPVLKFVGPLMRHGTVVIFDDWKAYDNDPNNGEQLAWAEFLADNPHIKAEMLWDFSQYGRAFQVEERNSDSSNSDSSRR